jgi:nicotinic acid mononucleotide adenylyltransferase
MSKKAIFTWGRFNPPTVGHKALIDQMLIRAGETGADPFVVVTHTQNKVKNPLTPSEKQNVLKNMYPTVQILASSREEPNPVYLVNKLRALGYGEIFFILGSDRNKNFKFVKNITRLPGIRRNETASGPVGMSATKARGFATARNRSAFRSAINSSVSNTKLNQIMSTIQKRMK